MERIGGPGFDADDELLHCAYGARPKYANEIHSRICGSVKQLAPSQKPIVFSPNVQMLRGKN
jgi:hypothetical protein